MQSSCTFCAWDQQASISQIQRHQLDLFFYLFPSPCFFFLFLAVPKFVLKNNAIDFCVTQPRASCEFVMNLLTSKGILLFSTDRFNALSNTATHENMWKTSVHSPLKGYLYTFLWTVNNSSDPQICAAQKYFTSEPELRSLESKQTMNQISYRMEELWELAFMKCTNSKDSGAV